MSDRNRDLLRARRILCSREAWSSDELTPLVVAAGKTARPLGQDVRPGDVTGPRMCGSA